MVPPGAGLPHHGAGPSQLLRPVQPLRPVEPLQPLQPVTSSGRVRQGQVSACAVLPGDMDFVAREVCGRQGVYGGGVRVPCQGSQGHEEGAPGAGGEGALQDGGFGAGAGGDEGAPRRGPAGRGVVAVDGVELSGGAVGRGGPARLAYAGAGGGAGDQMGAEFGAAVDEGDGQDPDAGEFAAVGVTGCVEGRGPAGAGGLGGGGAAGGGVAVDEQGEVVVGQGLVRGGGRCRARTGRVGEAGVVGVGGGEGGVAAVVVEAYQAVGGGGVQQQPRGAEGVGGVRGFGGQGCLGGGPGRVGGGEQEAEEALGRPVRRGRARVTLEHRGVRPVPAER